MVIRALCFCMSILLVFLAGCAAAKDVETEQVQEATPAPIDSPAADIVQTESPEGSLEALPIDEVWGDVEIKYMDYYSVLDIADNGDMLTVDYGEEDTSPRKLMTVNIYTGEENFIRELEFPWQASYGKINEDWIVYRVTSSYDFYGSDYEVYAHDRKSGEEQLLCEAPVNEDGELVSAYSPEFSLRDSFLLIAEISEQDETSSAVTSYEYNLETGNRTILAEQFAALDYADDFIVGQCEDKTEADKKKNYSLICKLKDGKITPITQNGTRIYQYDGDGHGTLMITAMNLDDYNTDSPIPYLPGAYLIESSGKVTVLRDCSSDSHACDWPSLSSEIAVWRYNQCAYAYDRVLGQTVILNDDGISNVLTTDKYIIWAQCSEENIAANIPYTDELCIIEICNLPGR